MDPFQIPEIMPESIKKVDEQFGDVESRLHGASSDKNKIGDDVFDNP